MGIKLAEVKDPAKVATPLKVIERGSGKASKLAVCERADGVLVLTRETERDAKDASGNRIPLAADATKYERETYWKPTPALSDIATAIACGLLA